jgi:hypothetical protein
MNTGVAARSDEERNFVSDWLDYFGDLGLRCDVAFVTRSYAIDGGLAAMGLTRSDAEYTLDEMLRAMGFVELLTGAQVAEWRRRVEEDEAEVTP